MLSFETARKMGIRACVDKIGRDFVMAHRDTATAAWGEDEDGMYCYVGVSDQPDPKEKPEHLTLDSTSHFPYYSSCIVNMESGALTFMETVCPAIQ